jgi:hypothetical protein
MVLGRPDSTERWIGAEKRTAGTMDIKIRSLLDSAEFWEKAGYIAAAVVVIGIVLESIELVRYIREKKIGEKKFELLGVGILLLGLIGEVVSQVQSNNRNGLVIGVLNERASKANKAANDAAKAAAELGVTVDNVQGFVRSKEAAADSQLAALKAFVAADEARNAAVIAQLEKSRDKLGKARSEAEAAAERAERAARTVAGRTITPEQRAALVAFWHDGPKGPINVGAKLFDEEAEQFAKQLADVLNAAGFQATVVRGPFSFGLPGQWILARDLRKWQTGPSYVGFIQRGLSAVLHLDFEGNQMDATFSESWGEVGIAIGARKLLQ